ncbi:MAG: glucose-1-phosphate adenylyltransferase [Chloroflexi bacterium]|nr:glucose-1-phosphate adenylyltransferase [Chloroflexota bacterium]MBP7045236.1 glucose-1-phosphate adenylyltransferase [Chloroflexota bacterium]
MRMQDVLAIILGGGAGTRLYPLTVERAKPAVPLAGKYRLIDIPMSNCIHAGIEKIAILTQFNSASLHRHIYSTYVRDIFTPGWVQILAAEQTPRSADWYQGTADAVRKQLIEIKQAGSKYVLILAGDHLYRMDYTKFVQFHVDSEADITIAVQPVDRKSAPSLGILKMGSDGQITQFTEKPKQEAQLDELISRDDSTKPYMASMGIYVFATDVLFDLLDQEGDDFGRDLIPAAMTNRRVMGYVFDGYWEDIGTIRRFFQVNLDMAAYDAPFDFYEAERPIYTHARFLPASEVHGSHLDNVLLTDGCRIQNASITNSVVGLRSIIHSEAVIRSTVIMGADYYETEKELAHNAKNGIPDVGIGAGTHIQRAIVDKNARIGSNVHIRDIPNRPDTEGDGWVARDGIILVPKNAIIRDGTVI